MGQTSWQIGSNPSIGAVSITVNAGSGNEELDILTETAPLYLYDDGSEFDAMFLLQEALRTNPSDDLAGSLVFLTRDRKVRIEFRIDGGDPNSTDIVSWNGAGASAFQELLGLTGTELSAGSVETFTAPETSPYLWSANMCETPLLARRGKTGAPYHDTAVGMSGTRVVVSTTNNSGKINDYRWARVLNDRYWSEAEDWGEYYQWWDYVQRRFRKFKIWQDVNELDASTSQATIGTALGPYVFRWDGDSPISFPFSRDLEFMEYLHTVELPCVEVDEYT